VGTTANYNGAAEVGAANMYMAEGRNLEEEGEVEWMELALTS
jgi:hypothetical protein